MIAFTNGQKDVISADVSPMVVTACAGSGKTLAAVHRVAHLQTLKSIARQRIALLSFSNVAIDTFRRDFFSIDAGTRASSAANRVHVSTFDSFIAEHIIRPHAGALMGTERVPYLITGRESCLNNTKFQFWTNTTAGKRVPINATSISISLKGTAWVFHGRIGNASIQVPDGIRPAIELGKIGAYSYELGRWWALRTLRERPKLLAALSWRFRHIIVDEAQDVGLLHQQILELMAGAGSQVSLIGDPHQAIYEFAGSTGDYMVEVSRRPGTKAFPLTDNFRSVSRIVAVANNITGRADVPKRQSSCNPQGAFVLPYDPGDVVTFAKRFYEVVAKVGLNPFNSAVVCRGSTLCDRLRGTSDSIGQGLIKIFAEAALVRDQRGDYAGAFDLVLRCIGGVCDGLPEENVLPSRQATRNVPQAAVRRRIWTFVRDASNGLPSSELLADTEWHPLLVQHVTQLATDLSNLCQATPAANLRLKLKKTDLPHERLRGTRDQPTQYQVFRVDTVHQAKGESLDAVLYLATKANINALMGGITTEDGRIGYVALTRAKDIFWLGVPKDDLKNLLPPLTKLGFAEWTQ